MFIPPPSEFKSRREWEARAWQMLVRNLAASSSAKNVEQILAALLTANERKQMIRRAAAGLLLLQDKSYREVGRELWLSPTVVSAIRQSLSEGHYESSYARKRKMKKKKK